MIMVWKQDPQTKNDKNFKSWKSPGKLLRIWSFRILDKKKRWTGRLKYEVVLTPTRGRMKGVHKVLKVTRSMTTAVKFAKAYITR